MIEELKHKEQLHLCSQLRVTGLDLLTCKRCLIEYKWNLEKTFENSKKYGWNSKLIYIKND